MGVSGDSCFFWPSLSYAHLPSCFPSWLPTHVNPPHCMGAPGDCGCIHACVCPTLLCPESASPRALACHCCVLIPFCNAVAAWCGVVWRGSEKQLGWLGQELAAADSLGRYSLPCCDSASIVPHCEVYAMTVYADARDIIIIRLRFAASSK